MTTDQRSNPYRGPFSFTSNDEDRFFGRAKETEELIKLIRNCQLTTLFGSSGTGKTSLIQAKLLPQLRREYFHPVYIRINFESADPLTFTKHRIVEELRKWDPSLPGFQPKQTLINFAAHTAIYKGLVKPVLFFDQFEELFTLGPKNNPAKISNFLLQLSDLIELRLSDNLKNSSNVYNISNFKVVFSLRQDWIAYLEDYSYIIPSVLENRYRLKKFNTIQAQDAIYLPAQDFILKGTANVIITEIGQPALSDDVSEDTASSNTSISNLAIDPFVLSLYCYQLYEKAVELGENFITIDLIKTNPSNKLIRNYYEEKIAGHHKLKTLIEDKLLNESGKRVMLPIEELVEGNSQLFTQFKEVAIQTGLIRVIGEEPHWEVEIIHDQMAAQIFESKNERITKEIHDEAIKKEKEAESLKQSAKKAKDTTLRISIIAGIVILLLIGVSIIFYVQANKIKEDAIGNHTIEGLQSQLSEQKEFNIKAHDSITALLSIVNKPVKTIEVNNQQSNFNEQVFKHKYMTLLNQQRDSMVNIFNQQKDFLQTFQMVKEKEAVDLFGRLQSAQQTITNLTNKLNAQTGNVVKPPTPEVQPSDFSNFKMINTQYGDGTYDLRSIKTRGFIFTFDIASSSKVQIGSIEIKVFYRPKGNSKVKEFPQSNFEKISDLREMAQPKIVVPAPKDIASGTGHYYEISYFIDRDHKKLPILGATPFIVSRPPAQLINE